MLLLEVSIDDPLPPPRSMPACVCLLVLVLVLVRLLARDALLCGMVWLSHATGTPTD